MKKLLIVTDYNTISNEIKEFGTIDCETNTITIFHNEWKFLYSNGKSRTDLLKEVNEILTKNSYDEYYISENCENCNSIFVWLLFDLRWFTLLGNLSSPFEGVFVKLIDIQNVRDKANATKANTTEANANTWNQLMNSIPVCSNCIFERYIPISLFSWHHHTTITSNDEELSEYRIHSVRDYFSKSNIKLSVMLQSLQCTQPSIILNAVVKLTPQQYNLYATFENKNK